MHYTVFKAFSNSSLILLSETKKGFLSMFIEISSPFIVKEIYGKNDEVIQSTIGDYYTSDGSLKEGFADVEKSLEATVNNIVTSHNNFIKNFR
ncbi:MAG: hypothetical protein EOO45_30570 [Flavobacterium sp.]|nr:MAG: hypothetical protein EOO45_30570 [Flavobacterium sp.]